MIDRLKQWWKDLRRSVPRGDHGRSPHWPRVRAEHLKTEPACQWCGSRARVEVHHIAPFHLHPELELDQKNLITLCEQKGSDCHLSHGHLGNFQRFNPHVRQDCSAHRIGTL